MAAISVEQPDTNVVIPQAQGDGLPLAVMALGFLAVASSWIPVLNVVSVLLGLVALGLATPAFVVGRRRRGRVLTAIGVVLALLTFWISFTVNKAAARALDGGLASIQNALTATDLFKVSYGEATPDEFGFTSLPVTVTNTTSETQTYFIVLVAENAEGTEQLDTSEIVVSGLEAGGTATREALFATQIPHDAVLSASAAF